jgi:hypothetical protein
VSRYSERLRTPWWWYPAGLVLAVGLGFEVGLQFFVVMTSVGCLVLIALVVPTLLGRRRVEVADGVLRAGPHRIAVAELGSPVLHAGENLRRRLGPEADPAATVCVNWWIPTAVEFPVLDPESPVPYWVVSTRRPVELATAVESERTPAIRHN